MCRRQRAEIYYIVTDFGLVPSIPAYDRAWRLAPKRKNGSPDRRFKAARTLGELHYQISKWLEEEYLCGAKFPAESKRFLRRLRGRG
jgi:hypothetical protein